MNSFYYNNRRPLPDTPFTFLPLGSVKPTGWLKRQLQIQADGQSGHLPEFWDSLSDRSGWLGGPGESWERGPYYLDGLLPLAYLLDDKRLIDMCQKWIDWALNSMDERGHFGPKELTDWWPFGIYLKVLTQYQEVTGDPRVIPFMEKFLQHMERELPTLHMHSWAIFRWADTALSIIWLYNRTGDPGLLKLAETVMHQGYNWTLHFVDFAHVNKQQGKFVLRTHVVNNAMGVKSPAIAWQLTQWPEHYQGTWRAIQMLDEYHGTAAGVFTGDEHYAGKSPTQGTELCAVVEYMFSLEHAIQALGDPAFGDRLEKICFNALPATFSADMWCHQYDQQANQVICTDEPREWTNNRNDSNTFGLEPQYGCCTANFHQGYPKFAANLWMATPDDGLAAVAYAPNQVQARIRGGQNVTIDTETNYPFEDQITMKVSLENEAEFPLVLRIPAWAVDAMVTVNGEQIPVSPGSFAKIERVWKNGDVICLVFPMTLTAERRYRGAVTLSRGPLVYSLRIGERWEKIGGEEPHADYAVYPTTPWNYGLVIDTENPSAKVNYKGVGDVIYSPQAAPVELTVKGKKIPEWGMANNSAAPVPEGTVTSSEPEEDIVLVPYGCAKLRITEFPLVEK